MARGGDYGSGLLERSNRVPRTPWPGSRLAGLHVDSQAGALHALTSVKMGGTPAHPEPLHLDSFPGFGHDDRPATPSGGRAGIQPQTRQAIKAAGQETTQVGKHGARSRLVRELLQAELAGLSIGFHDVVRVARLEELGAAPPISEPGGINAQRRVEHGP